MIHFVCGLPGTGKTSLITENIAQDIRTGRRALLIVPEQQTVEVERTMLKHLPPSAQLSFEVLNFSRLANKLFRVFGGLSYHYITPGMKHLLMWQTLRELSGMLREYSTRSANDVTLPAMMLSQVGEFKAYNISAAKLDTAAARLPEESALRTKLEDLSLIYAAYEGMVGNAYDDNADDLGKLADLLEKNNYFNGYNIYIDSFTSFTAQEYRILRRMFAQADNVTVTLAVDSPYSDAVELSSISDTARRLVVEAGDNAKITTLDKFHRFSSPELMRIGQSLWRFEATGETLGDIPEDARGAISILRCKSPYAEAEAVANQILTLLSSGYRRREIAVIARDAESYRGIIDSALEKAGIAFFLSEKTDLPAKPLVSMIFSALAIKTRNWRSNDVIAYLKSGIPDIAPREADIFENYASIWNINGSRFIEEDWTMNPEGYTAPMSERGVEMLAVANRVRTALTEPLLRFFMRLDSAQNVRELCEALRGFLEETRVSDRMKQYAARALRAGDKKEAAENAATFRAVIDVLSQISAALGDSEMSVEEFSSALRLVFANTEIGTIPTAADEVMIGSASMLRVSGIRCAILMGVCDGEFPARVSERGFFSDTDRRALTELGISLSGDTRDGAAEELLYCYRAMTLPSEKLVMLYHDADAVGKACYPSLAIRRVTELLPHVTVEEYGTDGDERLTSLPLAFEALPSLAGTPYYAPLVELLCRDKHYAALLERSRHAVGNTDCHVSREAAERIFGTNISLTQSRLDKYVSCHLSYYCRYVLRLMENERASFRYSDSGTFIHRILEVFMRAITDEQGLRRDVEFEDIRRMVLEETERYILELSPNREKLGKRLSHLFKRLSRLAVTIAMDLYAEFRDSEFVPRLFEARIGHGSEYGIASPVIELGNGSRVNIYGVVDRIDVFRSGDDVYIKVVDYKTGSKKFSLRDIERGLNTQLLLYLFAVCRSQSPLLREKLGCGEDGTLKPAGALYMSTAFPPVKLDSKTDEKTALELAAAGIRREGILVDRDEVIDAVSREHKKNLLAGITVDKDNKKKGDALIREEALTMLEEQLTETIRDIALEMKSGNAETCTATGDTDPCAYCKMKQFCRAGAPAMRSADGEPTE